jgi:hypothetical protein
VLLNNGNGTFAAKVDYPTGGDPWWVTAADLDGDGKLDLAVSIHVRSSEHCEAGGLKVDEAEVVVLLTQPVLEGAVARVAACRARVRDHAVDAVSARESVIECCVLRQPAAADEEAQPLLGRYVGGLAEAVDAGVLVGFLQDRAGDARKRCS